MGSTIPASSRCHGFLFLGFLPRKQAPEEVEQEDKLGSDRNERRNTNKNMDGLQLLQIIHCGCGRSSAGGCPAIPGSASA